MNGKDEEKNIKYKKIQNEKEEGEIDNEIKSTRSRSKTRNKEHIKKHYPSHRSRQDFRSRSRSHSHHRRNKHPRRHSKSRSPQRKNEKKYNESRRKSYKSRSRSCDKRIKNTDLKTVDKNEKKEFKQENVKPDMDMSIIKTPDLNENKGICHVDFDIENEITSPDNFEFSHNNPDNQQIKRREERQKKLEELKLKTSSVPEIIPSHRKDTESTIPFHMSAEDTTKLIEIVEKERERNLNEVEGNVKASTQEPAGEKTPDMFAETPVDELTHDKNILNLPLYESNEDQTGYYTPKLNEILNEHYKVSGFCGKGIFSNVVKAVNLKNNKEYAIKILRSIDVMLLSGEKERNLLKKFNELDKNDRSHILRLIDTFEFRRHICMVFDLYEMNLRDLLKSKGTGVGLPLNTVKNYAQQFLFAFDLIHKYKIIHADFKPDNAVVNKAEDTIKLCDFGSALQEDEIVITTELVSRFYRPPEIFLGCTYDTKIDIWSLGCTLFELYTGKILFPGRNNNEMIKLILQTKGKFSQKILRRGQYSNLYFTESGNFLSLEIDPYTKKEYIKEINVNGFPRRDLLSMLKSSKVNISHSEESSLNSFRDFLEKCLHLDPNKRFNALDALTHEFIGIMPAVNLFSNK